jgi:hypothetical protein
VALTTPAKAACLQPGREFSKSIHLFGVSRTKLLSDTNSSRLYDCKELWDALFATRYHQEPILVHAHRAILAAKPNRSYAELRLPEYAVRHHADRSIFPIVKLLILSQDDEVAKSETEPGYHMDSMLIAVTHLYGFDFMGEGEIDPPTSLYHYLDICVVAAHYEIDDLFESTLHAASRALTDCFSREDEERIDLALKDFLCFNWKSILNDPRYTPLLFKVLRGNLYKLDKRPVWKELLAKEPLLLGYLYHAIMEDQAQKARATG